MNAETEYKGLVTYFSIPKHFGFIDSDIQKKIFFYIDTYRIRKMNPEERKQQRKVFCKGDEVYFKVRPATKGRSGLEAYDLRYIRNEKFDLLGLINDQQPLTGYIMKQDGWFYIKDKQTDLLIPLQISGWEINLKEVYERRINELVSWQAERIPKHLNNLKAILPDCVFNQTYFQLVALKENSELITVRITGKKKGGYFGTFLNNTVDCFIILKKEELEKKPALNIGDIVACRIKHINPVSVMTELVQEIG